MLDYFTSNRERSEWKTVEVSHERNGGIYQQMGSDVDRKYVRNVTIIRYVQQGLLLK